MSDQKELDFSEYKNIVDICKLSVSALGMDDVIFVIDGEDGDIEQNLRLFLLPDTLLPVIAVTANALTNNLFESKFNDEVAFAFDIIKDESETLCFSRIVPNGRKEMDYIKQCLITTEVVDQMFKPDKNRKVNLTPLIKNWREFLNTYSDGHKIDHKLIYNDLIDYGLNNTGVKNIIKQKNVK